MKHYDYGNAGIYFITICTHHKSCLLSTVGRGLAPAEIRLTEYGEIAEQQLLLLKKRYPFLNIDQYVIMPNHIHAIFILEKQTAGASPRPTVTDIVCAYKSLTTKFCKAAKPIDKLFQDSFYEHIIRNYNDYRETVNYIRNNPLLWNHK